ncbi:MAG: EAL domain-containing protein [Pseudomonadota bacterium]
MGKDHFNWADVPAGHHNPLAYAVTARDQAVVDMVINAVRHKQVMLAYQSVVPIANPSQPAFYEGLARVLDASGRIIPARDFINAIEPTETGRVIDCLSLEQGLRTLRLNPDLRLSINMSARSIGYPRWMRSFRRGLAQDPTIAERLILEVTETSAMVVPELVVSFMSEFQQKGVSFAIDDFGSGYTSFRYLKDFQFDILKIDGQFIRGVADNADNQVVTQAIISVAHQFDLITVAEAVERPKDVEWLQTSGVDCMQGYFFGAPTVNPPWLTKSKEKATA